MEVVINTPFIPSLPSDRPMSLWSGHLNLGDLNSLLGKLKLFISLISASTAFQLVELLGSTDKPNIRFNWSVVP
jgi:hypothetical protein